MKNNTTMQYTQKYGSLLTLSVALLCAASSTFSTKASTIVSNDVTTVLWPSGAPYTFFDSASVGGGDINFTTNAYFERSLGTLNVGGLGSRVVLRGMGWAAAVGPTATNIVATFTYLGANGTNGGGDDLVFGVVTNSYNRVATAAEYVWVFDAPITNNIDGLSNRFAINLFAGGTLGTNTFRCKTTSGTALSAAKLSLAGSSTALNPYDSLDRFWVGNVSATWDTSTANWTDTLSALAYADGTKVWFDDTLATSPVTNNNITLSASHSPSNVVVNNDTYDYSLSGGNLAGAMSLTKQGLKTLTLGMANSYSGGTVISGGMIRLGNAGALGSGSITLSGGGISSDSATPRTLSEAFSIPAAATLGNTVLNGALTLSGPVNYAGDGRSLDCPSDVILSGTTTNGGLNLKLGNGTLTYNGVTGTVSGAGSQWQIVGGDLVVNGGSLAKSAGGIRIGNTNANGISRLVITNGAQVLMTGTGQNVRVGNSIAPVAAATSTNILDVSGTLAWQNADAGSIFMGPNGAFAQINLRAGGLLQVGGISELAGSTVTEINFLGGTLGALRDNTSFMAGLDAANINTPAGAIIDSGLSTITMGQSLSDPLASGGGVIKKGSGTLNFTGGGSYTGVTVVQEGTLMVGGSHPIASSVIVSNSAGIGASSSSPATVPNLTLNTSRVVGNYGNAGSGTAMTVSGGALNLSGTSVVELAGINLALGTYTVIDYSAGSISGAGSFSSTPILPTGVGGYVTNTGTAIQVAITNTVTTRIWYGYDNTVSFAATTNWNTTTTAWDVGVAAYADGQAVLFDDTRFGGDNTNINIAATVLPVAVTVNNSSSLYSFNSDSGAGIGGSAGLIKTGTGRLDINTKNTYSGATTVSGGTLGGKGVINGPATIGAATTLSPGTSIVSNRIGTLTISNSLALNGNVSIDLDKSAVQSNDVVNVTGALSYGGTLTPVNIGTNALVAGDSFAIFPAGGTGSLSVAGSPGAGLVWNFNAASGVLNVASSIPSPTPLNYTNLGGGVYQFSWTGAFKLQWQTNAASVGIKTNWVDYPITTNPVNVTNDATVPTTFLRLINL